MSKRIIPHFRFGGAWLFFACGPLLAIAFFFLAAGMEPFRCLLMMIMLLQALLAGTIVLCSAATFPMCSKAFSGTNVQHSLRVRFISSLFVAHEIARSTLWAFAKGSIALFLIPLIVLPVSLELLVKGFATVVIVAYCAAVAVLIGYRLGRTRIENLIWSFGIWTGATLMPGMVALNEVGWPGPDYLLSDATWLTSLSPLSAYLASANLWWDWDLSTVIWMLSLFGALMLYVVLLMLAESLSMRLRRS
ncbi:MAG: hypothetical protein IT364_17520 [Candidatus Hydrogenedentes bacterium]|nr:hypothetical protein [Candidatus Hydrogenedentota bacterium]